MKNKSIARRSIRDVELRPERFVAAALTDDGDNSLFWDVDDLTGALVVKSTWLASHRAVYDVTGLLIVLTQKGLTDA